MLKLLALLSRRQGVSDQDFRQLRKAELPEVFVGWSACRRYVQYDIHPGGLQVSSPPPLELALDAIEEIWIDEAAGDGAMPAVAQLSARLEASRLRDFVGEMKTYLFEEREIKRVGLQDADPGHHLLKRLVPLVRKAGLTREEFFRHWNSVHAPLLKAVKPGPRRYCQLCVQSEVPPPGGIATLAVDIDGFSESWFTDEREMNLGRDTPEGIALARDNAVYVERSRRLFFDEREIHCQVPH